MQDSNSTPPPPHNTQKTADQISAINTKNAILSELKFLAASILSPLAVCLILIFPEFNKINLATFITLIAISTILPFATLAKGLHDATKNHASHKGKFPQANKGIPEKNNSTNNSPLVTNYVKTILTMMPIAISISFILTLSYYIWALENNISQAFGITSIRFSQDKYRMISATLMILFILYLSLVPLLALKISHPWQHPSFLKTASRWSEDLNTCTSATLNTACIILLTGIPASLTFRFMLPDSYATNIHLFTTTTFLFAQTRILAPTPPSKYELLKRVTTFNLTGKGLISTLVFLLSILSLKFLLPTLAIQMGESIVATGPNAMNPMRAYSCIFSQKDLNKESIAFGIVADSKDSSIHIFSPEYNSKNKSYVHVGEDGKIFPNTPLESYINLKENYIIEQYDDSKHNYDWETGKCTHK